MLNSEIKTYDEKYFQIMLCRFSNDLFALKECHFDFKNDKKNLVSSFK